jgi:mono/diheme cytochrome c family protein
MEYPVWLIPGVNKGLIIGVISVLHVFIAQFAVGGGVYLAWAEGRALRHGAPELLIWLEKHTRFFLLLTMVFGGLSGVAIWFSMTVTSPAGTALLTHNFVYVWAAEWAFFLLEIVALLLYYYTYPLVRRGAFSARDHLRIGWVYALAGFMSLFLINGILAFMLTTGQALDSRHLWDGFFNPNFWPSLVFRFALCLIIAGMFALFTAWRITDETLRRGVTRNAALWWICLPLLALLASSVWYYQALPPDRQAAIARKTLDIHPFVRAFFWVLPLTFLVGVLAFIRAQKMRLPLTVLVLVCGLALAGSFEWIRETGRRPWLIPGYMYSNGITVSDGERMNQHGAVSVSGWNHWLGTARAAMLRSDDAPGVVSPGALLFAQQCASCHGINGPRLDVVPLLRGLTREGIRAQLAGQGKRLPYMPPFFGNERDRASLAGYLHSLRTPKGKEDI